MCPFLPEPKIDSTSGEIKIEPGIPLTLQCNLTANPSVLRDSYWVKNGEEISGTRKTTENAEYK